MNGVEIVGLRKEFPGRVIFQDASLLLPEKGLVVLLGKSGTGKSTLLSMAGMLDSSYSGTIRVLGADPQSLSEKERGDFRIRNIGMIRQENDTLDLEDSLTNVLFPSFGSRAEKKKALRRASDLLNAVGLEGKERQRANTLSGGERARLSLARALVNDPRIVLADEPTGALDEKAGEEVFSLLSSVAKDRLVLVVTHDERLARRHGQMILRLEECKFHIEETGIPPGETLLVADGQRGWRRPLPSASLLLHGFHVAREKKWRALLFTTLMSLSILLLGTSLFLSRELERTVGSSLSGLAGEREVVLMDKGAEPSLEPASEGQVESLLYKLRGVADSSGLGYPIDFASFFPDELTASLPLGELKEHVFPNLDVSSVDEYRWLEDYESSSFHPGIPEVMEMEHVVIALPFPMMSSLCSALSIERSYRSLGHYLEKQGMEIYLRMRNDSWAYHDEQVLVVRAVMETEGNPFFLHSDHFWNEWMYEFKMRLPLRESPEQEEPWLLEKIPYLHLRATEEEAISMLRGLGLEEGFILVPPNAETGDEDVEFGAGRLYAFSREGGASYEGVLESASRIEGVTGHRFLSGGYSSFPSSYAEGFLKPFFLAGTEEAADLIEDSASKVEGLEDPLLLSLPDCSASGSYLLPAGKGIRISANLDGLIGKTPSSVEEVALGEALWNQLGRPERIIALTPSTVREEGDGYRYEYRRIPLYVTGYITAGGMTIHQGPCWAEDFFLILARSLVEDSFTKGISLSIDEDWPLQPFVDYFAGNYPEFSVASPALAISESLAEMEGYLSLMLLALTIGSVALSCFLLFTVSRLFAEEGKREGRMLHYLGFSREEVARNESAPLLILLSFSALSSMLGIFGMEWLIHGFMAESIGGGASFSIDPFPLFIPLIASFLAYLISYFIGLRQSNRRNFLKEGR